MKWYAAIGGGAADGDGLGEQCVVAGPVGAGAGQLGFVAEQAERPSPPDLLPPGQDSRDI